MTPFVLELAPVVGLVAACAALAVSRATFYRRQRPPAPRQPRPTSHRALPLAERARVLTVLNSERFADKAPAQVYADLLDEEKYFCSVRTMYRILAAADEVRERRDQLRHPVYKKPELLATAPNQVWSWDISKLKGPEKWTYFYLYVVLDIFSRYVVGWMVAVRESAALGQELVRTASERQGIEPGQLVVHADRGSPMTAKSTALLYADLGISKSHSRPHVSNDNPFSEAQFKTIKYRPELPERFGSVQDARHQVGPLLHWYNHEHKHSSLALLTPADVHYGRADAIIAARQRVLDLAHVAHPERFVRGLPKHPGPVPLGYAVVDKRLVVNELEAVLVREIFALYLEHRSALVVARLLNKRHRSTKRHRATNGHLREARTWTKASVLRVLRNLVYAGYMPCGGELHDAEHTPIISRETFARVQALLDAATFPKKDCGRNPAYLLRGLLRCACCGASFTPASTRSGRREFRYYRCITRDKGGRDACRSAPLPADAIEETVLQRIRATTIDGSLAADITARVKEQAAARRKDLLTERRKLPAEIASLSDEGKRLVATIATANAAARRLLDDRLREIGEELSRREARLAAAERELAHIDAIEVEVGWVASCLADFDKVWDVLTAENRGRLLRAVVERVDVNEPENQVSVVLSDVGGDAVTGFRSGQGQRSAEASP